MDHAQRDIVCAREEPHCNKGLARPFLSFLCLICCLKADLMFVIRLLEMGIHAPKSAQALLTARVQGDQPPPAPVCQLSQGQPAFQHSPEAAGGCHWSI